MKNELTKTEIIERLNEIQTEMLDLLNEAYKLVPENFKSRAEVYWYSNILIELTDDHDFVGRSGCNLECTINEIESEYN